LVVSSDLSHFSDYDAARRHDERTAAAIEALDEAAIGPCDACGHLAIRGALREAARRGLEVQRLALCNSGDI
jgi:AmmeMemoRadiSam system protein B